MLIKFAPATIAVMCADTHKSVKELEVLETDGPFLIFNFGPDATADSCRESLRDMDAFVGGLIADEDNEAEIVGLSSLKSEILRAQKEVEREFAYIMNASATTEAILDDTGSQLHGEQNASTNDSSSSNDADSSNEELSNNGETKQSPRSRKRS